MEKIKEIVNIRKDVRFFKTLSLVCVCFALLTMLIYAGLSYRMYQNYQNAIYILDNQGVAFHAELSKTSLERTDPEIYDHIVNFHKLFFEIDQFNYVQRIDRALYLIDDSGKQLYNNMKNRSWFSSLVNNNVKQSVRIDTIQINLNTRPYVASIKFRLIHEGYDPKDTRKFPEIRVLVREFNITPVDRNRKNPHGLIISNYAPDFLNR